MQHADKECGLSRMGVSHSNLVEFDTPTMGNLLPVSGRIRNSVVILLKGVLGKYCLCG